MDSGPAAAESLWVWTEVVSFGSLFTVPGRESCCAVDCRNWRGKAGCDGVKFYRISKDKDARLVWISRINRLDLRVGDLSKNTRLCSAHFHDGVKTADQPYPIKFSHKTYPLLCRGNPTRRLSSPGTGRKR